MKCPDLQDNHHMNLRTQRGHHLTIRILNLMNPLLDDSLIAATATVATNNPTSFIAFIAFGCLSENCLFSGKKYQSPLKETFLK